MAAPPRRPDTLLALVACTLLCAAIVVDGDSGGRNEDFVFVAPCSTQRMVMAHATRYWRKGMRAVWVVEQPKVPPNLLQSGAKNHERFTWYPDFYPFFPDGKTPHYMPADRRAAMAPLLAYRVLGGPNAAFKWMLFGDDDTFYLMHGVRNLLRDYDPQLPYFLTDSMYAGSQSPKDGVWDLKCEPCHVQQGKGKVGAGSRSAAQALRGGGGVAAGPQAAGGCGCTTEAVCRRRFPTKLDVCLNSWEGPVPFGGVGFIFSIGFFRALEAAYEHHTPGGALGAYDACVNSTSLTSFPQGGDAIMSRCLWRMGFPITDMGYTKFGRYLGEIVTPEHLFGAPRAISEAKVPVDLESRWASAVSLHLEARMMKSWKHAAATVKYYAGAYDLVADFFWGGAGGQSGGGDRRMRRAVERKQARQR